MSKGKVEIISQALTTSSDYIFTVPVNCVSFAFYVKEGDVTMLAGNDPDVWNGLASGSKEAFNDDVAFVLRGTTFTFNAVSTATLEIRTIVDFRVC